MSAWFIGASRLSHSTSPIADCPISGACKWPSSAIASIACSIVAPRISSPTTAGAASPSRRWNTPVSLSNAELITGRDGPVDTRRDVGVEPHLAFVEAQRETRLPARRIGGRDLENHRFRACAVVGVRQRDAIALAHLAGTDAFGAERFDRARAEGSRQPVGGQVIRPLDSSDRHSCCPCGRCQVGCRRRRAPDFGRRTRTA